MTTHPEPTTVEKWRGLPWSIASNAANTVFVQFTFFGSVFVLFLSALGLSKGEMGLLLSLLPFTGVVALFVAPTVERYGYKRVYVTFFSARSIIAALLLLTPWVLSTFGKQGTLLFVSVIVATFSLVRSIGMTASLPWIQEYIPDSVRGKYTAANNVFTTLVGFLAVMTAGYALRAITGLSGYIILIGIGVCFGFLSVWLAAFIPGGAPRAREESPLAARRDLWQALGDRQFLLFLTGVALLTLSTVPLGSFLPLFMREQVGLQEGEVVWLQIGSLAGALVASPIWGWAADRYGSKPVIFLGIFLRAVMPLFWLAMPRHTPWGLPFALATFALLGMADMGWGIGSARLLYVNVVPPTQRSDYLALYNAWTGVAGGISQVLGGWLVERGRGIEGQLFIFTLDPYLPLFLIGMVLPLLAVLTFRVLRVEGDITVRRFFGIFLRGNPFLAMTSLVRYQLVRDEQTAVHVTAQLGQARSPLAVEELLEALADPRFNVRFEAIQAIAHSTPDERLIAALGQVLHGPDPALSVLAAWALGRLGDEVAIDLLREALNAEYRSVRAHASRALATLGDQALIPLLMTRLPVEPDYGLRVAYASALGSLRAAEATPLILDILRDSVEESTRLELALALARLLGDEHHFIRLLRQTRSDVGTATAQELASLRRRLEKEFGEDFVPLTLLDESANAFAHDELEQGAVSLGQFLRALPRSAVWTAHTALLEPCALYLSESGAARHEYLLLALHTLHTYAPEQGST